MFVAQLKCLSHKYKLCLHNCFLFILLEQCYFPEDLLLCMDAKVARGLNVT